MMSTTILQNLNLKFKLCMKKIQIVLFIFFLDDVCALLYRTPSGHSYLGRV